MKVTNFYYITALVFGSENYVGRGGEGAGNFLSFGRPANAIELGNQ